MILLFDYLFLLQDCHILIILLRLLVLNLLSYRLFIL
nr:MAG TPA: hypothetical protein [Caudoviricetes sp.]